MFQAFLNRAFLSRAFLRFRVIVIFLLLPCLSSCTVYEQLKKLMNEEKAIGLYNDSVDELNARKFRLAYPKLVEAHELAPANARINRSLGRALVGLGKAEEGLKYLKESWDADKSSPGTLVSIGNAYQANGEFGKAAQSFEEYFKLCPQAERASIKDLAESLRQQQAILDKVTKSGKGKSQKDYLAFAIAEKGIARWHQRKMPLAVAIETNKNLKGHRPHLPEIVMKACKAWEKGSNGAVRFKEAKNKKNVHIRCRFLDDPSKLGTNKQGETTSSYDMNGIKSADLKILTLDRNSGKEQSDDLIYHTALHEIGHSLGIDGHSPHHDDIMFFSELEENWEKETALSGRDLETIKLLYASPAAFMPPKGSKSEKEVERIRAYNEHIKIYNEAVHLYNKGKYQEAIEKADEFLRFEPKSSAAKKLIRGAQKQLQSLQSSPQGSPQGSPQVSPGDSAGAQ